MPLTAKKITAGRSTIVVLVDENGVEHGRCGGKRAERARFALVGRRAHKIGFVEGSERPEVGERQSVRVVTEQVEAGRLPVPAGTTRGEWFAARDRLEAEGHEWVSLRLPKGCRFPFDHADMNDDRLVGDGAELIYGKNEVVGWEVYQHSAWLVGLRAKAVNPTRLTGCVGYERVDQVLPIH